MINRIDGFLEEKNGDKYLNIADRDRNIEVLKNTQTYGMESKIVSKKYVIMKENVTKIL